MASTLTRERVRRDVDIVARAGLELSTFLEEFHASVERALPSVAGCFATFDPATVLLTGTQKTGDLDGRDERDADWGTVEYVHAEETSFVTMARQARRAAGVHASHGGDVHRSLRMRDFIEPYFGYRDELRVLGTTKGSVWGGVALFRDGDVFSDDEILFAASLSQALGTGMRGGLLARQAATTDADGGPSVLVFDHAGELTVATPGAEGRAAALGPDTLAALLAAAGGFRAGLESAPPRLRVRDGNGRWLVIHASPVVSGVVVTIEDAGPPAIVPLVVDAFDLTPRERQVTELVLQGVDTREIARELHMSTHTVQDHLKSIFDKAGVRSRRELTARVFFDQYLPRL